MMVFLFIFLLLMLLVVGVAAVFLDVACRKYGDTLILVFRLKGNIPSGREMCKIQTSRASGRVLQNLRSQATSVVTLSLCTGGTLFAIINTVDLAERSQVRIVRHYRCRSEKNHRGWLPHHQGWWLSTGTEWLLSRFLSVFPDRNV